MSRRSSASRHSAAFRCCLSTLGGLPPLPPSLGAARVFAASSFHDGGMTSHLSPVGEAERGVAKICCFILSRWGGDFASVCRAGGRAERSGTICCFILPRWGGYFVSATRAGGRAERCGTICCFILPQLTPLPPKLGAVRTFAASPFHAEGVTLHLSPVRGAERGVAVHTSTLGR